MPAVVRARAGVVLPAGSPEASRTAALPPARSHRHALMEAPPRLALPGGTLLVTVCSRWIDGEPHPLSAFRPTYLALPR